MDLIKITDLTSQLQISSGSLRYYEQMGLIQSVRPDFEKYRYYDDENIERLKQIIVLRKMQIPIKDILHIYESQDMSVVVETFVSRLDAIDEEITALSEMKQIVNDFLQTMLQNGITKISALPLLYDEMDRQLEMLESRKPVTYSRLSAVGEKLAAPVHPAIVYLPAMRVLSSFLKRDPRKSDSDGLWRWAQANGIVAGSAGRHERFEFQTDAGDVILLRIADDFINSGEYLDYIFDGGMFATVNVYLDEDLGERFRSLVESFDDSKYYEIDYAHDGSLRHQAMLENLISPNDKRELVCLLVPVKKRRANPALFDEHKEIEPDAISIEEIEKQNPVLWEVNVQMDQLTPVNGPHYRITEQGEAEYISWILTRVLSTNVEVKLPFRVDIEFRIGEESGGYGHGSNEESIRFYHGHDLNHVFGINMGNNPDERLLQEAICFHQPVFGDYFSFPKRGRINPEVYNKLTWVVGDKHFAVIINGEVRYCGINFPYMTANLSRQQAHPIIIGSGGSIKKYFRSICISQLMQTQKSKIKEGELTVITKRSNNIIPNIRRFITSEYGENYWFNGCGWYVMECLGETDYDYGFFAGLTGDVFAQVYSYNGYRGEGATDYRLYEKDGAAFIEDIFDRCGYAATFVAEKNLRANPEMYLRTLMAYIDKGVPVICNLVITEHDPWIVFVGYEEYGKTLLFLTDNMTEPERVSTEDVLRESAVGVPAGMERCRGWVFVGEKKQQRALAQIYRDAIYRLPRFLSVRTEGYCFGAGALRAWADGIEGGRFDGMKLEEFDDWRMHSVYICNLATNGSCCHGFLHKARELNPDMVFLEDLHKLYRQTADIWNNQKGEDLEALGGGFNITLGALQDKAKRDKIAAKIRECAACMDEVVKILNEGLK